ncbi:MAG: addiction module antidote protein, HigA family, partial [Muribaculaceae bacterium]|nr:addiction module antidote protein, HigA family [Muribaculaceae bacterium]
ILNCRRSLTPQTAMLFEAALGISAEMLMGMQMDYTMRKTASEPSFAEKLRKVRQCVAAL